MDSKANISEDSRVWRYMGFFKFVWMLQNKSLWLARSDLLGDTWEISLSGEQLQLVYDRHPPTYIDDNNTETAQERAERIINKWRRNTFINCWNISGHESNALWEIYCKTSEGIVIQTTYEKLNSICGDLPLLPVDYQIPGSNKQTPTHSDLASKKRPMFSYEDEIRIVHYDKDEERGEPEGIKLDFSFNENIESIRVHPKADKVFFEAVQRIVETYIPNYDGGITWSDMRAEPLF